MISSSYFNQLLIVFTLVVTQPALSSGNMVRNKINPETHIAGGNFSSGIGTALKFGVHEIILQTNKLAAIEKPPIIYINSNIENGSAMNWELDGDSIVYIHQSYEYERGTLNRESCHRHFLIEARKGTEVPIIFDNFYSVYNGEIIYQNSNFLKYCVASTNGKDWKHVPIEVLDGNRMKVVVHMETDSIYIASADPYRVSDLERLLSEIKGDKNVEIKTIGKSVEGRGIHLIRIGDENSGNRVFIRARAHSWEAGGNWVVEGLIKTLLDNSEESNTFLKNYCLYILPMANIDGVANGGTRYNMNGIDLNRGLDKPACSVLAPENYYMMKWLERMIGEGRKPALAIDFHNDANGQLLLANAGPDYLSYLVRMKLFEQLLKKSTWFTEGSRQSSSEDTFGSALTNKYGIPSFTFELNAAWVKGLKKKPLSNDWLLLGEQLGHVFDDFFKDKFDVPDI